MKYDHLLLRGRPSHVNDAFSRRHPKMPLSRRAKLFMPFDALNGFSEAIRAEASNAEKDKQAKEAAKTGNAEGDDPQQF